MRRRKAWVVPSVCASLLLATGSEVQAYCRTTTARQDPDCPSTCVTRGTPLYWGTSELSYVLNRRGFPGFSDEDLRRVASESFGTWENVACPAPGDASERVPVGLEIVQDPGTTVAEVGPMETEPNENVVVYYSAEAWDEEPWDNQAFALTSVWYDARTGRIIGADIHFNGAMTLGECPDQGCDLRDNIADLRNVLTHEIGHFLGLSHSEQRSATMWCDARAGDVDKRTLSADDIEGLCAVYPPGEAFPDDRIAAAGTNSRCAVAGPGAASGWIAVLSGLGAALLLLYRRRKPAPTSP